MSHHKEHALQKQQEVRVITGNAPWCVLYCQQCQPAVLPNTHNLTQHYQYSWAVTVTCETCKTQWNVCTVCDSVRKPFIDKVALYNHHYKKHRFVDSSVQKKGILRIDNTDDDSFLNVFDELDVLSESGLQYSSTLPTFDCFTSPQSQLYFKHQNAGLGAAYLVAKSQFSMPSVAARLDSTEVSFHIKLASLICTLTRHQRDQLAVLFDESGKILLKKEKHQSCEDMWFTRIPHSPQEMRSLYMKGKDALIPNLPRPTVQIVEEHAYISLRDCVADLLGHGLETDFITEVGTTDNVVEVSQIGQCMFSQAIYKRGKDTHGSVPFICLYVLEWSDGFEPSISTKANRGSCWIKSVTISPTHSAMHKLTHTYPIAIGPESENHACVEEKFMEELEMFKNGKNVSFYHGRLQRNVIVYLELLVSLQDQPERRSANYVMLGGSRYTARWGVAIDLAAVASNIPSCKKCFKHLLVGQPDEATICYCCTNWETDRAENVLLHYPPPNDYPTDELSATEKLTPIKLSYSILKRAVSLSLEKYQSGLWMKKNVIAYLRVHGINKDAINMILNSEWKHPPAWQRGITLLQHIDVPMHLIFLGVVKTCIQLVHDWMTRRHKSSTFIKYARGTLESIQILGLSWCKSMPYKTGKLGGWVSENYLAHARLITWFYGLIDEVAVDQEFIVPNIPQKHWTRQQNQVWLSIRGLNSTGNAVDLRNRVQTYMSMEGGPPPLAPLEGGSVKNVQQMLFSLKVFISHVMDSSLSLEDIGNIERYIKIFLNYFEHFDKGMRKKDDIPTWITSYNFICLTNIPDTMRQFGPIRNYWEGGGMGEKLIQLIKPLWNGFRKNWQVNIMDKMLRQMAIERVQKNHSENNSELHSLNYEETSTPSAKGKLYFVYNSLKHIQQEYNERRPLSIIQLDNGKFLAAVTTERYIEMICGNYIGTIGGAHYHHWSLTNSQPKSMLARNKVAKYCLLLPKLTTTGLPSASDDPVFTAIDSDWNDIQPTKVMQKPNILDLFN